MPIQLCYLRGTMTPASVRAWQVSGAVIAPSTAKRSNIVFNSANCPSKCGNKNTDNHQTHTWIEVGYTSGSQTKMRSIYHFQICNIFVFEASVHSVARKPVAICIPAATLGVAAIVEPILAIPLTVSVREARGAPTGGPRPTPIAILVPLLLAHWYICNQNVIWIVQHQARWSDQHDELKQHRQHTIVYNSS